MAADNADKAERLGPAADATETDYTCTESEKQKLRLASNNRCLNISFSFVSKKFAECV